MVLTRRIIPCLDVMDGRVVKGIKFLNLKDAGDPVEQAIEYDRSGADELVFLDIRASHENREIMKDVVNKVAKHISIPFTVGGGLTKIGDIRDILSSGADKISLNTAAVKNSSLVKEASKMFGSQCIVVAIDAKRHYINEGEDIADHIIREEGGKKFWWELYIFGGRKDTGLDALIWAKQVTRLGAGEILITSMDRDGTKKGYDILLTRAISELTNLPTIASGGAGTNEDIYEALTRGKADAALAASIFHYGEIPIPKLKEYLHSRNLPIRQIQNYL
ncbi:MAG: imidazole glycerol phosphate synthase subunit HisF [Candidatus Ranarchaeia archaeon]